MTSLYDLYWATIKLSCAFLYVQQMHKEVMLASSVSSL